VPIRSFASRSRLGNFRSQLHFGAPVPRQALGRDFEQRAAGRTNEQVAEDYTVRRIVTPEEMAAVVMFLDSHAASALHGTDVDASGGYLAG
jgi:NAD(P)-dependent dehydrogenase (short-subunit alcohol dehydrogenase family)